MMETPGMTPEPMSAQPKKSNTGLIIGIVVVVLLCCCCVVGVGGWWLYNNGDQFINKGTSLLISML
jgi:hypothetical protein